ncbi:glutaredoxin [Flaviflexus salsibiostraticola]|uniref:Glutaredoxin n=1 Tax=Flaviflexus salsibiostraticola TaxID=1282737 RepID=A0A3Q8WW29_9ACTO|nr:glutaredoxin family protein [Flaviflexus salsibiostraticola]AZN30413.1 glutaredoxin [Flaviflexus salsibiostraticola]
MRENTSPPTSPALAEITLVTAPACKFCDDAHERLGELESQGHIQLHLVDAESQRGRELIAAHRPGMFPLVLVEGRYFHDGRLPRGKMARLVQQLKAC